MPKVTADYPTSVWDETAADRDDPKVNAAPGYQTYDQLVAELVAVQTDLTSMKGFDAANASGGAMVVGTPVYMKADASGVAKADANGAVPLPFVLGLLSVGASGSGGTVHIRTQGEMELTIAQWDAVGTANTGLVAGTEYFLSGTVGEITGTKPATTGDHVVSLGVALSTTVLRLDIRYRGVSA